MVKVSNLVNIPPVFREDAGRMAKPYNTMMKKNVLTLLCVFVFAAVSQAQVATNERFFKQAAVEFKLNADANYAKAMVLAKRHNWPLSFTARNGNLAVLVGVDAFDQPKYYITNNNTVAAATTKANQLWPGGRSGLNLTGSAAGPEKQDRHMGWGRRTRQSPGIDRPGYAER
jgi:hypothetical protein